MAAGRGDFDGPANRQLAFDLREVGLAFVGDGFSGRRRERHHLFLARQETQSAVERVGRNGLDAADERCFFRRCPRQNHAA